MGGDRKGRALDRYERVLRYERLVSLEEPRAPVTERGCETRGVDPRAIDRAQDVPVGRPKCLDGVARKASAALVERDVANGQPEHVSVAHRHGLADRPPQPRIAIEVPREVAEHATERSAHPSTRLGRCHDVEVVRHQDRGQRIRKPATQSAPEPVGPIERAQGLVAVPESGSDMDDAAWHAIRVGAERQGLPPNLATHLRAGSCASWTSQAGNGPTGAQRTALDAGMARNRCAKRSFAGKRPEIRPRRPESWSTGRRGLQFRTRPRVAAARARSIGRGTEPERG